MNLATTNIINTNKHQKPTPELQTPNLLKCLKNLRTNSTLILNKHLFMLGICITYLYPITYFWTF